jgi:hypothetical protein
MYLRKIIEILLDLAGAASANSRVLWRAGAKCKRAIVNRRGKAHPLKFVTKVVSIQLPVARAKIA